MDIYHHATHIVKTLVLAGYTAYFAGGWVRDYVMKHPSSDIDIATDAPPEKILDLFPRTVLVGLAFGVVIVLIEGHQYEVSTFRKDLRYEGGRRPVGIELSNAMEDAQRRDFTINGMFYDPLSDEIIDYVGGIDDIKKEVIRTIGNPQERFLEDRLRMIRAVRFASRFNFHIDIDTQQGILENAETLFPAVAMERVWQEFNKMATYPHFDQALIEMHRLGLLPVIFPTLRSVHLRDVKQRLTALTHFPQNTPTIIKLMELFPDTSLQEQIELCNMLRVSGQDIRLLEYVDGLRKTIALNGSTDRVAFTQAFAHPQSQVCVEAVAARYPSDQRQSILQVCSEQREKLFPHIERAQQKKLLVTAPMLLEEGIAPGKEMGLLLKEAEKLAITQDLHLPQEIIALLKKSPLWRSVKPC